MKISELMTELERLKQKHGDLETVVQTMSHLWAPEPILRQSAKGAVVLLNP